MFRTLKAGDHGSSLCSWNNIHIPGAHLHRGLQIQAFSQP